MHHVRHALALQRQWRIRSYQYCHSRSTIEEGVLLCALRRVCRHSDRPPTIIRFALDPVCARKQGCSATVAGLVVVDTFDAMIA